MNIRWFLLAGFIAFSPLGLLGYAPAATRLDFRSDGLHNIGSDFAISADGKWVVYRGMDESRPDALYCVSTSGGEPEMLNGELTTDGSIAAWQLSASGQQVVYLADQETAGLTEVFLVPMPAGGSQKLNGPLVEQGSTSAAFVGGAGNRVAYIGSEVTGPFTGPFYELFSVPTGGGDPLRLNGSLVNGGDVHELVVRSDGGRLLYLADQEVDERLELYSVSPDGGAPVKLSGTLVHGGNVLADGVAFSPDGNRVLYVADQEQDQRFELYSVPTLGGTPTRLNGELVNGGDVTPGSQRFSPDGSRVLYHADQDEDDVFEIYSVPSTGGTPIRLNGSLVNHGDVNWLGLQFSPDGARILYTADQFVDEKFELFSVPAVGGAATKLSGELVSGGDVEDDAVFSPDGSRVLFRADARFDDVVELFTAPSDGGARNRISGSLVTGGNVIRANYSPDGSHIIYLADQEVDEVFELFAASVDGSGVQKISGPMAVGGDVVDWQFTPDGGSLIYRADQEADGLFQLYSVNFSDRLPGDFNADGVVDAADYTIWRDGLGIIFEPAHYEEWKSNFGRRAGAGASAPGSAGGVVATVPEPASICLIVAVTLISLCGNHRRGPCTIRSPGNFDAS